MNITRIVYVCNEDTEEIEIDVFGEQDNIMLGLMILAKEYAKLIGEEPLDIIASMKRIYIGQEKIKKFFGL